MYGPKRIESRNYRSLVIAGTGTIGRSLVTLGAEQFSLFEHVVAVDRDKDSLMPLHNSGMTCLAGDIADAQFLHRLMTGIPNPVLFVNLCSATDNVRIRNSLSLHDAAYLDSCASVTEDPGEYRFSRLMPYTYTEIYSRRPHWLCWGINPGLVEITARRILAGLPPHTRSYDVSVFEFDRLANGSPLDKAAVGWCPEALVEEIMLSPTLEIRNGQPSEDNRVGTRSCFVNWEDKAIQARIVGHEDIWNLGGIAAVRNGSFYYSLSPAVMDILNRKNAGDARNSLYIPGHDDSMEGIEQVAVQVSGGGLQDPATLVWTEDHAATSKQFGLNAVQYQTAKSLLLAIMLLQRTDYGLQPLARNASSLPIGPHDWPVIDRFMQELGINWQDGAHLNLEVVG